MKRPGTFSLVSILYRPVIIEIENPTVLNFNPIVEASNPHGSPASSFSQIGRSHTVRHPSPAGEISIFAQQFDDQVGFISPDETIWAARHLLKMRWLLKNDFYVFTDESGGFVVFHNILL